MEQFDASGGESWTRWRKIPASILSDCVGRFGAMSGAIRCMTGVGVVGPAFPLRTMPGDNRTIHLALREAAAGTVLVIDAGGYQDRAVWGEVLTRGAIAGRIAGVVIDGATRDVAGIRALGFPVYARAASPAGPHKAGAGVIGEPVSCGGVVVGLGDLVVADEDGVTVAPAQSLDDLYDAACARIATEQEWMARIAKGESTAAVLGLIDVLPDKGGSI